MCTLEHGIQSPAQTADLADECDPVTPRGLYHVVAIDASRHHHTPQDVIVSDIVQDHAFALLELRHGLPDIEVLDEVVPTKHQELILFSQPCKNTRSWGLALATLKACVTRLPLNCFNRLTGSTWLTS